MVETVYIDDFTRASRDELEWWKLAALLKRLRKRMIEASDSFDLDHPNSDLMVTMFGLLSRMFIKSTREKSSRGMKGAAGRGSCLGKLSLGFTRRHKVDQAGNFVMGADGLAIYEPCIDPETSEFRWLMYELYVVKNWSISKIAKHFNEIKVDGWNGCTASAIKQLPETIGLLDEAARYLMTTSTEPYFPNRR